MVYASHTCMNFPPSSYLEPLLDSYSDWVSTHFSTSLSSYLLPCPYWYSSGLSIGLLFLADFSLLYFSLLLLLLSPSPFSSFFFCVCCIVHVCICMFLNVGAYMNGYRDMRIYTYMWRPKVNVGNQPSLFHLIQRCRVS